MKISRKVMACLTRSWRQSQWIHPLLAILILSAVLAAVPEVANAKKGSQGFIPGGASVTTLVKFPYQTEGLTGDDDGNLYTAGRNLGINVPCPVYRVNINEPSPVIVGYIPTINETVQCSTSGLALNDAGDLFVAADGRVYRLTPNEASPPTAQLFAVDVPGANGIAFDHDGYLWVSDGITYMGRVWAIPPTGGSGNNNEKFRIQPMRNSAALTGVSGFTQIPADGIGRQVRSFPPGSLANNSTSLGDSIVANGLAFDQSGNLYVADTARAAVWKVELDQRGHVLSPMGCDATFAPNTLCLTNLLVAHPLLEGIDGIALDVAGNIWAVGNGRNAVVVVTKEGSVREVFRNPINGTTGLRNAGDQSVGNEHVLEFPASPYLLGDRFCTSSFDSGLSTRDNWPFEAGELSPTGAYRGKISCLDQDQNIPGLPLPL